MEKLVFLEGLTEKKSYAFKITSETSLEYCQKVYTIQVENN